MTCYRITHVTSYSYDGVVSASFGSYGLRPRELPWQQVVAHQVRVEPAPADQATHLDPYGNARSYFHLTAAHTRLTITGSSTVVVASPPAMDGAGRGGGLQLPWEECRPLDRNEPDAWEAADFTLESPMVDLAPAAGEYAAASFTRGRPLGAAVVELMHRIHRDFEYRSGSTTVTTRVGDVLTSRRGVCQDFAHLMIAGLRSHGLAARYVSGYLATRPAPGRSRLAGADASHAWVGCWIPGEEWLYLDPTNDRLAGATHATVAWGRDYGDVAPVKGVIYTSAASSAMTVEVDMVTVGADPPRDPDRGDATSVPAGGDS